MNYANLPLPYTDDVEMIPADEADDIQRVVQPWSRFSPGAGEEWPVSADVHVKTHGYAQGEFRVLPNLPENLPGPI